MSGWKNCIKQEKISPTFLPFLKKKLFNRVDFVKIGTEIKLSLFLMCNKINFKEKTNKRGKFFKCFLEWRIFFYKRKCNVRSVTDFILN